MIAVTESAELEKIEANRGVALSPIACAAKGPRHAAQLKELEGMIFSASGCKYRLPKDRPVDVNALDAAIRGAHIDQRMRIKSAAHALNLIA